MTRKLFSTIVLAALGLAGCSAELKPRTELVLVADSDIPGIDNVEFRVLDANGREETARSPLDAGHRPAYLGVVRKDGSLGPLTVSARGFAGITPIVESKARVYFVPEETRVVPLHLLAACRGKVCPDEQACREGECQPIDIPSEQLASWSGAPPKLGSDDDAGNGDGGGTNGGTTGGTTAGTNNGPGDGSVSNMDSGPMSSDGSMPQDSGVKDAGGAPDSGVDASTMLACGDAGVVDTSNDINHCGGCDQPCILPSGQNALAVDCVMGKCVLTCATDWGDCDGKIDSGCEQDLNTLMYCGSCTFKCAPQYKSCSAGTCFK